MATVTHIIRSHYDSADREKLEHETGQRPNDQSGSDPWQTESSFSVQRRIHAAPTFVPAVISHDEWGVPLRTSTPTPEKPGEDQPSTSTAAWYRSLTAATASTHDAPQRPSSAPSLCSPSQDAKPSFSKPYRESITKNNWFITKALRSEPSTKTSSPVPSLADLLARDPPPLPSERQYTPPVWLHIGPSNRGFDMLQRSGWSEGEGLGAHIIRRTTDERALSSVKAGEEAGTQDAPEVIDLTLSDSEVSEDASEDDDVLQQTVPTQAYAASGEASASHVQRSLLTPLPTILKADRLGIGLKAKTEGPYKQSRKRVTHNAAALAAHIRTAEEMRRHKALVGKGRRGFAKVHKRDEDKRKAMLSYLNE